MWRPIGTRASVRRDLPGPSNAVVVVLCICMRDSCWLGFVQVCNKLYWDLIHILVECLFYTITWSGLGFRGCCFTYLILLHVYVLCCVARRQICTLDLGPSQVGIRATGY